MQLILGMEIDFENLIWRPLC